MHNHWTTRQDPLVTWVADLSDALHRPEQLLNWLQAVLEAGEAHEVYSVRGAPRLAYRRQRDGSLSNMIASQFMRSGVVDLFHFTQPAVQGSEDGSFISVARMAYYDHTGEPVLAELDDLGLLLRSFYPEAERTAPGLVERCPPLDLSGPRIDVQHPERSSGVWFGTSVRIHIGLPSDIWLPWVPGILDESYDPDELFDNRELARQHTPRLNRFLAAARDATGAIGGVWSLDEDELSVGRFMVNDDGIIVEAELPEGLAQNTGQPRPSVREQLRRKYRNG